jgi:hypothetical protein
MPVLARTVSLLAALFAVVVPAASARVVHPRPWSADFSNGLAQWSFWGQGQASTWGHVQIADPRSAGIDGAPDNRAVRFETTPSDITTGHVNAKLFKWWHRPRRGRWDISGRYCATYWFPGRYHAVSRSADMIFQFKQEWVDGAGFHQDPMWWVEIDTAREWGLHASRPDAPVAVLYHLDPKPPVRPVVVPLRRWLPICATVRQGRSIRVTIGGRSLGTGRQARYPVGPQAKARRWIFGIGNYSRSANGPLWVDRAWFVPRR